MNVGDTIFTTLTVKEVPDGEKKACDFCSTIEAHQPDIAQRGLYEADYRLVNTYGVTFGYTCHSCISGSRTTDNYELTKKE